MSLSFQTITKSVKLQAGEIFTLPPGATLVSATDINAITSTCDTGTLEELICYTFVFGNAAKDGNVPQFFEECSPIVGIKVNNKFVEFPEAYFPTTSDIIGQYNLTKMVIDINNATGGALIDPKIGEHNEGAAGIISFITFKAIPSVANTLELKLLTCSAREFNADENLEVWFKPRLTSTLSHYSGLPTCS